MWYTGTGQEEVYGQMLVDCFAIDVSIFSEISHCTSVVIYFSNIATQLLFPLYLLFLVIIPLQRRCYMLQ